MSAILNSLGLDHLSVSERLRLVEELWDSIDHEQVSVSLSDEQKAEIDRRLASHKLSPERAIPWEVVKAEALARIEK